MRDFLTMSKPKLYMIVCASIVLVFLFVLFSQASYLNRQQQTIDALTSEYATLRAASAELQEQIDFTYTDSYIEREARSRFGLIKDGETLYQSSGAGSN